ncbi:MAG: hypothetical protein H6677_06435 [Candidatus Obscuribacterales bacterium]|nr:hypothetical protein [Cyanobacteria bacterium HKST-UBA01]MCB9467899.1 hypothetical protein [Candidatus Obscuribacterales bacterium]
MNAHGTVCQICGKLVNLESPGLGDSCPGHGQSASPTGLGSSLKNQLDAIPTPGGSQAPAPSSDEQTIPPASQELSGVKSQMNARPADGGASPWGAPKGYDQVQGGGAEQDFKSQLDAIPTPGGSPAPAPAAPAPAPPAPPPPPQPQAAPAAPGLGDLKSQLDAIPTPGGQPAAPAPQPQAAPMAPQAAPTPAPPPPQPQAAPMAPQAAPAPQPQVAAEDDWKSQLDAIPTPKSVDGGGTGAPAGLGAGPGAGAGQGPGAVRPTPMSTPQPGAMASDMFAGGTGASNQSGSDYARSKEFSSVDTSSGYTMIAVVLVLVVLCVFGFMMMNPGKQPDFSSVPTSAPTTTTAPAPAPTTNAP